MTLIHCHAGAQEAPGAAGRTASQESGGLFSGVRAELGPVRWAGNIGQQYEWQRSNDPGRARNRLDMLNLSATSYFWQPWLAQLRAGIGVIHSTSSAIGGTPPDTTSSSSESTSLTGDVGMTLFPVSRFPFEAYASSTDSRTASDLIGEDFVSRRVGMRQGYRTRDERTRVSLRYDQSELISDRFGRDTLDVFEAGVTQREGKHNFDLTGNTSSNRGGRNGTDSDWIRVNGRHTFTEGTSLSTDSLASYNENTVTSSGLPSAAAALSRVTQITSFGTWRPDEGDLLYQEGRPLIVTASARAFAIDTETAASETSTQTGNATVGASYAASPHTRLGASASATQTSSGGSDIRVATQTANVTYTPDPIRFGDLSYVWNTSGAATNATTTGQGSRQSGNVAATHNLTRSYETAPGSRVSLVAGQGAGLSHTDGTNAPTLNHSGGVTWSQTGSAGAVSYVGLNLADSRTFRPVRTVFQMINLQLNRQDSFTAVSYWSGNLTVQGTRQRVEQSGGDLNWTTTGTLVYRHMHALGVPRLRFTASYMAASQQLSTRAGGDASAPREFVSSSAEALFDYNIGKLEMRLSARTARVEARRNSVLYFRILRNF